jgi:DNA-binding NarL/FixJ family response regulator
MDRPIRVLVVDDHLSVRQTMSTVLALEDDIDVVADAADAAGAIAAIKETPADVALVDYLLEGLDGIALAIELRARAPETKVIILTAEDDDRVLIAAMEAGCAGFLTKLQSVDEILTAVRAAAADEPVVSSGVLLRLLPQLQRRSDPSSSANDLTDREREVLLLMARGATNPVMAAELFLSLHTVRNHVQSVLRKLNSHSKLEAVAVAVRTGVIPATRTG